MLDQASLALAIDIQGRSFKLLRWINEQIRKGLILTPQVSSHSDSPDPALAWIQEWRLLIPEEARPDPAHLRQFARFFWTYLLTSFDVVENPGFRGVSVGGRCTCELCSHIQSAPNLQPKKLQPRDKNRAAELMSERIQQLADEEGIAPFPGIAKSVLNDPDLRPSAGYSAYGYWLIQRMAGLTDGPAILALWREIAWNRLGSPLKDFKLRQEDFIAAERSLVERLRTSSLDALTPASSTTT